MNVSISGGNDNDTITDSGSFVTINGGLGDDLINLNAAQDVLIEYAAGDGSDTVSGLNATDTVNISGGEYTSATVGNDVVLGVGEDSITLAGAARLGTLNILGMQKNFFTGTEGADSITNTVAGAVIAALGGNDTIYNSASNVSINAGAGDDYFSSWYTNFVFFHEGGNDTIGSFSSDSTLKVAGGSYTSLISNYSDLILIDSESGDSINLLNGRYYSPNIVDANGNLVTVGNALDIVGTEGADSLNNTFDGAKIRALGGDDTIANGGATVSIDAGNGNDSIDNIAAQVTITGGDGDDYVNNNQQLLTVYNYSSGNDTLEGFNTSDSLNVGNYNYSTFTGDDGNIIVNMLRGSATVGSVTLKDYSGTYINVVSTYAPAPVRGRSVSNERDSVSVIGSAGNDTITNSGNDVSIRGDAGNDQISLGGASNVLIQYTAGDGNDVVDGFSATSTLRIGDGSDTYATQQSGSNVLVRVGNGSVILAGATSLATVNIEGYESDASGSIITLTEGDDTYYNDEGEDVTILALGGDDSVESWNDNVSIDGGAGNDSIYFGSINVTVTGGAGDDSIYDSTDIAAHVYGGGNDTIYGFDKWSTIVIADSYSTQRNGRNVEISVQGKGTLTLEDYWDNLNIVSSIDKFTHYNRLYSDGDNTVVTGTSDADHLGLWNDSVTVDAQGGGDYIYVAAANDSINGGDGDDFIKNNSSATVNAAGGNDVVFNWSTQSSINGGAGTDSIYNSYIDITINGGADNDTIYSYGSSNSIIDGGAGNDYILQGWITGSRRTGDYSTLTGGDGDDTVDNYCGKNVSISGGAGNDYIENENATAWNSATQQYETVSSPDNATIDGGAGNDNIYNYGASVSISGGAGNDYINNYNDASNVTIDGGDGDDTVHNYGGKNVSILGGNGNDYIYNENVTIWNSATQQYETVSSPDNITIDGGAGSDNVYNYGSSVSIDGGDGSDTVWNNGANVSISGGDGSDTVYNWGANVSIHGGAGNDSIQNGGTNVSMHGGAGDDRISLSSSSRNNLVRYGEGDGNDTVWGITENDTLNFLADESLVSSVVSGDDLIYYLGSGSVRLIGARDKPPHITYGESGTSGGGSNSGNGGNSSGGSGGNSGGGGHNGGNTSGGTSASEGRGSAASGGGRSASGSSGRSVSERGGGGHFRYIRNEHSTTANAPTETIATALPESITQSNHQTTATTTQQPAETDTDYIYTGYNQVISDYASDKKIFFCTTYTGAFYDGNGNFFAGSTTGALVVQNAADKVIDLKDAAGNDFVKAYSATTAGVIDGRGLAGFELINGSAGADAIYAGDGGSQLWGGADTVSDAMMGGGGTDIFIGGRTQGADFFLNASSADIVHLNDSALSDIVATAEENGTIGIAFNTGNVVAIQSSEALSATVMLTDGSAYKYNHANKSWQSA